MRVLVACEFSGVVRDAFTARGHLAWSCDLLPNAGPHTHRHIVGDVRDVIVSNAWDLMIAHPPRTYLCASGLHWNNRISGRAGKTAAALDFVKLLLTAPIPRIALENPVGKIGTEIRPADQYIQPYQFGHDASKRTGLWLKNLPKLRPTAFVEPRLVCCGLAIPEGAGKRGCPNCCGDRVARRRWGNQTNSGQNKLAPSADRWKLRSVTYAGIADAMAEQWGALLNLEATA